ncbi:uncharacterized protein [Temnothorax longispinosus]|uniref:uncharacterized protein isoform X3 n=1 Tax=Temnothorax longispinosus TaxID=300112 RepID=UPI003A9963B9
MYIHTSEVNVFGLICLFKMPMCSVSGCKNKSENAKEKNIQFFSYPKDEETALKWMQAANKNKVNLKNARICSVHFTPSCYKPKPAYLANCENYSSKKLRRLHDHAIPTENLPLLKEREVLKEVQNQHNIINVSENSSFSESETNLIDTSMENKAETCFMQSSKENASSTSDDTMVNTQSNSQTVMSEHLRLRDKIIQDLMKRLSQTNKVNDLLKKQVKRLQREKTRVTKRVIKENVHNVLKRIFTPKQIDVLMSNERKKRVKWGLKDISAAIMLRSLSPKAYRFLKENHYPLPGLSTLRNWASRMELKEGILSDVVFLMKKKAPSFL